MRIKKYLLLYITFICLFQLKAQSDSLSKPTDSINLVLLRDYNKQLIESEKLRISDSIKRVELESELKKLRNTDSSKKQKIELDIQDLKNKEIERLESKKLHIDSIRKTAIAYPVIGLFNESIFNIYNKSGSFSAKERAEAISKRINKLTEFEDFQPDNIKLVNIENTVDLIYGELIIISISESDALWNNSSKQELAQEYKSIIANEVVKYKSETSILKLAKNISLAVVVIILFVVIITYLKKFFEWTALKIESQKGKRINGFKIKDYTLFDESRLVNVLLLGNKVVKWFVFLVIIYIALPILFGIFPWTKNFAEVLFGYFLNPLKSIARSLWNYLPNLITIIVIVVVFRYILKGLHFLKYEIEKENLKLPGFYPDWANPTFQIIRVVVFAFMIVVIFPYLPGSDSPVFKGVSVFLGFLFTFGSAGSLSNIIAGLILTYMRLFKIGDRVKIGEVSGDIIEKSLLVTRVRTIKNEIISIPNSTVMNSHTINYSSDAPEKGLIVHSTVTIGYDVQWRDMHQALIDAAIKTDFIVAEPLPFVLQTSLDDFYVSYQINAYTKDPNKQAVIYSHLHQNIQDICIQRGIEIMSPHYRAERDGNKVTIPTTNS